MYTLDVHNCVYCFENCERWLCTFIEKYVLWMYKIVYFLQKLCTLNLQKNMYILKKMCTLNKLN